MTIMERHTIKLKQAGVEDINSGIGACLSDFAKFIDYNETERPVLSAKAELFGKKDCFKLNGLLHNPKSVNGPNYFQPQYPVIDLMFELALKGRIYIKANDDRGKFSLVKTPNFDNFQKLNDYEKYVFILQTYWTEYEFDKKFAQWIHILSYFNLMSAIANSAKGQKIIKDMNQGTSLLYSRGAAFFHHLRFFGWGDLEINYEAESIYDDSITAFYPNRFGQAVADFLITKALLFWNLDGLDLFTFQDQPLLEASDTPFDVFKNIFKNDLVQRTLEPVQQKVRSGMYCFKISLSKSVWRKVCVSPTHTLEDLHFAIQKAFDFNSDHLYAFYVGGNHKTGEAICCKCAEDKGRIAEDTFMTDLELYEGTRMVYLFDFGDEWIFNIELLQIDTEAPIPLKPIIVESKGKAPAQYES